MLVLLEDICSLWERSCVKWGTYAQGPEIELHKVVNFFLLNLLNAVAPIILCPFKKNKMFYKNGYHQYVELRQQFHATIYFISKHELLI